MHTNPNCSIREHILNISQKLLLQKRSTLLFSGGYKQFSNLVFSSSCVEEGILTINFFTTTAYSEVVLLVFYMAQQENYAVLN